MCLAAPGAAGDLSKTARELIGTWDYMSLTALKDGKPFGTVHFQPGQWTLTLNQDATWTMKQPSPSAKPAGIVNGTYEVRGHDVDMKRVDGSPFKTSRFKIEHDGKVLILTDTGAIIRATREQ
jgi:hypothetical protein